MPVESGSAFWKKGGSIQDTRQLLLKAFWKLHNASRMKTFLDLAYALKMHIIAAKNGFQHLWDVSKLKGIILILWQHKYFTAPLVLISLRLSLTGGTN